MKKKQQRFVAHASKDKVSSLLEIPAGADALVVLGHGAGAGMMHSNMQNIAEALHSQSIGTFRYQFPFIERGGGRDSKEVSLATVTNAVETASKLAGKLPLYAGGHSFGGRMTSLAAAEGLITKAKGLVFFAFPLHAPGKPAVDRAAHLKEIKVPMLFLSGTRDKLMSLDLFKPIAKQLGKRATVHYLDTADHGYKILKRTRKSEVDVFEEMGDAVRQWIQA